MCLCKFSSYFRENGGGGNSLMVRNRLALLVDGSGGNGVISSIYILLASDSGMKLLEVEWMEAQHSKWCTSASIHVISIQKLPLESRGQEYSVFGIVNKEDNMRWWVNWLWWWQWGIFQNLCSPCSSPVSWYWYWLPHRSTEGVSRQVTSSMLGCPRQWR